MESVLGLAMKDPHKEAALQIPGSVPQTLPHSHKIGRKNMGGKEK